MKLTMIAVLTLLLVATYLQAAQPPAKYIHKPVVMSLFIGGNNGKSYEITYDARELRYYEGSMFELREAKGKLIKPSDEQWQAFFDELDAIGIWSWKRGYTDPDIADGTSWRTVIVYSLQGDYEVVSSGSNAYPHEFKRYLAAVRKLVGDRQFE